MDRQLLSRATENSDAPTPGYMYLDIAKNAATNPSTCADIAKYLTNRLSSRSNTNVKHKCLKVIAKTAVSPFLRGQFKRCLSQDPEAMAAIKGALQFRGPPDPVRGDEPYRKVRQAAQEALDAVYSDTPQDNAGGGGGPGGMIGANHMSSSYGQSPHHSGGGGGAGAGGARRMEGIGNPMFQDPRLDPSHGQSLAQMTVQDVMKEAKETVIGMIKDPLAKNATAGAGGGGHTGNMPRPGGGWHGASPGGGGGGYSGPPGKSELMHQTNGEWTMATNRGPDAVTTPPNYANDAAYYKSNAAGAGNAYSWAQKSGAAAGSVGGTWASPAAAQQPAYNATPSIQVTSNAPHMGGAVVTATGGGGTAVSDGSYEKQLIMELCPPGGMKPEPPPDKLAQFSRSVASLNSDLVCPVLLDCVEEGQPWIIRAKAIWVIESCVKYGQKPGFPSNPYTDFFHACQGEIAPLVNHGRAAVRDPAKRVLALLGVSGGGAVHAAAPTAAAVARSQVAAPPAPAPPAADLLDFGDPTPAPATPAAPATAGGASLFGGLNVAAVPVAPATAPPSAPPPPPAMAPPVQPSSAGADLLMMSSPPAAAAPMSPAPAVAPGGGGASMFGDMTMKGAAPAAPPPASPAPPPVNQAASLFDSMSLKPAATPTAPATPAPAAIDDLTAAVPATGSAFGFINPAASTEPAAAIPAAAAAGETAVPGIGSMDSFDPLKNMTPNTAKKMMQVSPEQMQAMAYQQMMMQQQYQMMLAMQQQQRSPTPGFRGGVTMPGGMPMPPGVMQNPAAARTSLAFMDQPQRQESKSFDFVKDAINKEHKK